jgi:hypothetical protein
MAKKARVFAPIYIRPLEIKWSVWRNKIRKDTEEAMDLLREQNVVGAMKLMGQQAQETDAWLRGLTENQQQDIQALARAEMDMLWETIYPSMGEQPKLLSDDWSDFRIRYFELVPLVVAFERVKLSDHERVRALLTQLEEIGMEKEWLP